MTRSLIGILNYFRAALITGFFAALVIYLPTDRSGTTTDPESVYGIMHASIQADILQGATIADLKEIHGIKVLYADYGKCTYYFKYEADPNDTLKVISELPFALDNNPSSVACMLMNANSNPLDEVRTLATQEQEASSFFWNSKAEDFTFYECVKSPFRHTVLISRSSPVILHRVESI
jgi:hypothetical protein